MTKRQIIKLILEGKEPPYVPWSFRFTQKAEAALVAHYFTNDIRSVIGNHIIELGSDFGIFTQLDENHFQDAFGVIWDRSVGKDIGSVSNCVLQTSSLKGFEFPDPLDKRYFEDILPKIQKYGDCFRLFCIGFSLFERAWTLRGGMENLLTDFYDAPEFVHELFEAIADFNIAQIKQALKYDIDAVFFSDDWGQQKGLLMGYEAWKEFIYPAVMRMYKAVRDDGNHVFIHSCGDVDELFDDLIGIGVHCFNPFEPGVMDVDVIMNNYRSRLAFWGGLSMNTTASLGSYHKLIDQARHLIEMGRQGGYILSPSHFIEADTPIENTLALIEVCKSQKNYKKRLYF